MTHGFYQKRPVCQSSARKYLGHITTQGTVPLKWYDDKVAKEREYEMRVRLEEIEAKEQALAEMEHRETAQGLTGKMGR